MFRILPTRRLIDAFFIILVSFVVFGCEPAGNRDDERLAKDGAATAEVKRIDALLRTKGPVTRLEIDSLERLRAQYPGSTVVRQLLQGSLVRREDWVAVERLISETPESGKTTADNLNLARVFLKQGRFGAAASLLKSINVAGAEGVEAAALLGQAQFYSGDVDAAALALESVQADLIAQKRGDELAILGTIYFRRGDNARALDVLQKAVDVAPENISAISAMSRVCAAAGDEAKAASFRARLDSINEKIAADEKKRSRTVGLFYQLEDAYSAREYEKVIGLVRQLQPEADPNTKATLYQYLAAVYKAQGNESEANAALAEAAKLTQK